MIHDLIAMIGLFLLAWGLWMINISLSLIIIGTLLIIYSLVYELKRGKKVKTNESS